MVLRPEKAKEAEAIFRKWGLDFAVIGQTTDTKRFVIRHHGQVKADLPIKELGDEAPLYDRPWERTAPAKGLDPASVAPPMPTDRALLKLHRLARSLLEALGLRAIQFADPRQHGAGARRRRGGDPARRRAEGPRAHHRLHRALLRGRPASRAAGRRSPRRGAISSRSARSRWRSPTISISAIPRRPDAMGQLVGCIEGIGEAARALDFPDRLRQCLALQRDDGVRHSADARHRRGGARGRCHENGEPRLQGGRRGRAAARRRARLARPFGVARDGRGPRGGRAAARRSRRRAAERRIRARADRRGPRDARCRTSPTAGSPSRSPKWRWRAMSARPSRRRARARLLLRRGSGALRAGLQAVRDGGA